MPQKANYDITLDALLKLWAVCLGSLTVVAVCGWFVPYAWMPLLSFALIWAVIWFGNYQESTSHVHCSLITHYTVYALFVATILMAIGNYLYDKEIAPSWLPMAGDKDTSTVNMPYISSCVIYPVAAVTYLVAYLRRKRSSHCAYCRERAGGTVRSALEHDQFSAEAKRVLRTLFVITALLAAIDLSYFLAYYDDTNINTSDTYFLFVFPAISYVLSIIYISTRLQNVKFEANINAAAAAANAYSQVRYMVVHRDKIMLRRLSEDDDPRQRWDTPAAYELDLTEHFTDQEATKIFASLAGTGAFRLKHLFDTSTVETNTFHYAAFIDDDIEATSLDGEWLNLYQIDTMLKAGEIARQFAYEIHRVYTMTMAWKSYDREGRRLYPIKNYKPTFRIADFKDWNIDYSDMHWMAVAENNADQPWYKLRRFWRRHISGADKKWKKKA